MQRRHFLKAGLGFAALGLSGLARADAHTTYQRFHAALARDRELTVYANLEGNQQGHAHVEGRIPAELQGTFFSSATAPAASNWAASVTTTGSMATASPRPGASTATR